MGEKSLAIISILVVFGALSGAYANGIYKYVDENGHITFTNRAIKKGGKLMTTPTSPKPHLKKTAAHKNFPRVSNNVQKKRDLKRHQILENELATETRLLTDALQTLSGMKKTSVIFSTGTSQFSQKAIKYKAEINKIQDKVLLHERNITALKKELANHSY